jgi:hypothetical protein
MNAEGTKMLMVGPALTGSPLRRLRRRARARAGEWVAWRTRTGLELAWRTGADGDELCLGRPGGVPFEWDLLSVLRTVTGDLGLTVVRRRVQGHSILVELAEGGGGRVR